MDFCAHVVLQLLLSYETKSSRSLEENSYTLSRKSNRVSRGQNRKRESEKLGPIRQSMDLRIVFMTRAPHCGCIVLNV